VRRLPRPLLRLARAAVGRWPVSDEKISLEYKLKRFLEGAAMAPSRAHVFWNGTFSEAEKRALLTRELPGSLDRILTELDRAPAVDSLSRYLGFDQKYYLPDDILTKADRISMAHSLEVRPPFLDHRIVEFSATLPPHLKVDGARQKVLLKQLMKDKLPAPVLHRSKVGFDIPAHEWLRGPLRSLLTDTLSSGSSEHRDLFRREVVTSLLDRHLERRVNIGYHLWGLMILFLWMKKWQIQSPSVELNRPLKLPTSEVLFA